MSILHLETGRLDVAAGVLDGEGGELRLTPIERKLVEHLAAADGAPVSREELQRAVWGYRPGILTRTVFTTIGRLRAKLERDPAEPTHLVTVPGRGYALRVDGPLAPAGASSRLPQPRTPLIGRRAELSTLSSTLAGGARLLSLHGPGGVGKTRLALELLHQAPMGLAGVFVPLEGSADVGDAVRAVAAGLEVELGSGPDPVGELELSLSEAPRLVVLDNAEHLLPEVAGLIDRLVGAAPRLRVVVTTRRRLGLSAEHVYRVEDLETPVDGTGLEQADAGRLMLQAAGRARVGWEPDAVERDRLAEACRIVGGSPLAIELLASWLRLLDPEDLVAELRRSDEVLRASERDRPARHESIAVALEASCGLLDERAASLLTDLAVFHGPFDRALATEVAGATLATLGQLVDAALLHRVERRFDLHPLVRRFARARLARAPDGGASVRRQHQQVLLARLAAAFERRHDDPAWAAPLEPVRAEVLEAWAHATRVGDREALAAHLRPLAGWLDQLHEPRLSIAVLGATAASLDGPIADAARLLSVGSGGPIPEDLPERVRSAGSLDGPIGILALIQGAIGSHRLERPDVGLEWAFEAVARADVLEPVDPFLQIFPRGVAGSLLLRLGRLDEARACLQEALSRPNGETGVSRGLVHLGQVELARGAPGPARDALLRAIDQLRREGDRGFLVMGLTALAATEQALGRDPEPILVEALEEGVRSRLPPTWYAGVLVQLAACRIEAGDVADAARLLLAVDPSDLVLPDQQAAHARGIAVIEARIGSDELAAAARDAAALRDDPRTLLSS